MRPLPYGVMRGVVDRLISMREGAMSQSQIPEEWSLRHWQLRDHLEGPFLVNPTRHAGYEVLRHPVAVIHQAGCGHLTYQGRPISTEGWARIDSIEELEQVWDEGVALEGELGLDAVHRRPG